MLSVKHAPESQIPAVGKLPDDFLNVLAIVGMEQRRDVFQDHPRGLYFAEETNDLEEEAGAFAAEADFGAVFAGIA